MMSDHPKVEHYVKGAVLRSGADINKKLIFDSSQQCLDYIYCPVTIIPYIIGQEPSSHDLMNLKHNLKFNGKYSQKRDFELEPSCYEIYTRHRK